MKSKPQDEATSWARRLTYAASSDKLGFLGVISHASVESEFLLVLNRYGCHHIFVEFHTLELPKDSMWR
jgi:hypothetical protein